MTSLFDEYSELHENAIGRMKKESPDFVIYTVEYRKYENKDDFKHYRAFFHDGDTVYSFFEKYMNDEEIDTENWIEVIEEFIE